MPKKFVADDGSTFWLASTSNIFPTEAEALADENAEEYSARVQLYLDSRDWSRGQETRAKSIVTEFLAFEDTFADGELEAAIAKRKAEMDAEKQAAAQARKEAMKHARESRGSSAATESTDTYLTPPPPLPAA